MKRFTAIAANALTLSALIGATAIGVSAQTFPLYLNNSGVIRQVTSSGTVAPLATVTGGLGMTVSDNGRTLFVATGTGISRVNLATGAVSAFESGLSGAKSLVTDAGGNLYTTNIAANGDRQILKFALTGGAGTAVATLPSAVGNASTFGNDLAFDTTRNLLYSDGLSANAGSTAIFRVDVTAGTNTQVGEFGTAITGLAINNNDQLFAAEFVQSKVYRIDNASAADINTAPDDFLKRTNFAAPNPTATAQKYNDVAYNAALDRVFVAIGGSSAGATNGLIASKASTGALSGTTGSGAARADFTAIGDARYITFAAVPAPSSVAVMAMGGLMPLVAFARRRRAAK